MPPIPLGERPVWHRKRASVNKSSSFASSSVVVATAQTRRSRTWSRLKFEAFFFSFEVRPTRRHARHAHLRRRAHDDVAVHQQLHRARRFQFGKASTAGVRVREREKKTSKRVVASRTECKTLPASRRWPIRCRARRTTSRRQRRRQRTTPKTRSSRATRFFHSDAR